MFLGVILVVILSASRKTAGVGRWVAPEFLAMRFYKYSKRTRPSLSSNLRVTADLLPGMVL